MKKPRQKVEQFNNGVTAVFEEMADSAVQGQYAPGREDTNSIEQDPGLLARFAEGKSIEDWKIERLENFVCFTQAVNSMSSYKAQNGKSSEPGQPNALDFQSLWTLAQEQLKAELSTPAYETWLKPCRLYSQEGNTVTLATGSDFNRNILTKRYGAALKQVFSALLGQSVTVRIVVDSALDAPLSPEIQLNPKPDMGASPDLSTKYPVARFQNPTNNPQVAMLLERYGDIRGVMKKHPFFQRIQKPVEEGGWGTDLGGLIYFAKEYTLERVLWAAKQAKEYQGADSRGAVFTHAVRNGLEAR